MDRNERLKTVRKQLNLTQAEIADKLDVTASYISDLENGRRTVTDKFIKKIEERLSVNSEWIYTEKGNTFKGLDFNKFANSVIEATWATRPNRHGVLSPEELSFEYNLIMVHLEENFSDRKNLNNAMYKMGAPEFMLSKFPKIETSFEDYVFGLQVDYLSIEYSDLKDPIEKEKLKKLQQDKMCLIEKVYHPAVEYERRMLSKLINYLNEYADMFKGGLNAEYST